jgi:hypothetical protein
VTDPHEHAPAPASAPDGVSAPEAPVPAAPQWAAPAAPPFGAPTGPPVHPAYAPPPGYTGQYLAGASPRGGASGAVNRAAARGSRPGVVALMAALGAAVLAPIGAAIAAFNIGIGAGREIALRPIDIDFDWSILTPVREWVLLAEMSFWVGTVLGTWAIVQGIVAIVTRRGRGAGIAAVVIGALGVIVFAVALQGFLTVGLAAAGSIGG